MPRPDSSITWWMTLSAVGVIAAAAFLLPWALTSVLRVRRGVYLTGLMLGTGALTYGYLAWSGTRAETFLTRFWGWGLLGALLSGAVIAGAIAVGANRRGLPKPSRRSGGRMLVALGWEGVLYGVAEGLLLSALPVLAAWQTFQLLGWTDTAAGVVGSGGLAVVASAVVIWVHHLGYAEYRRSRLIVAPILACGLLSVAYLLTRSMIAPVGGHFLTHAGLLARGIAMPPYSPGLPERQRQAQQEEAVRLAA